MSAQVTITQLPAAGAITGTESVPIVQNGVTVQTTTGAIANSPTQTYSYLTVTQTPQLPNSRYVGVTNGLVITDGGSQGLFNISTTGALLSLVNSGTGIQVKTSSTAVTGRSIAVSNAGLSVTDGDGVAGNPTLSLSGLPLNLANLTGAGMLAITSGGTSINPRVLTGTASQITVTNGDGQSGNPTFLIADNPVLPGTSAMTVTTGTSAQQPVGASGQMRFNSDTQTFDGYASGSWRQFSLTGGVTSFTAGSTGFTPNIPTSGAITLGGILNVANGGSGVGTLTGYLIGNGTSPFTASATIPTTALSGTITNAQLANSSVTYNGVTVALGASGTITAASPNALTISTGLTGTSYNGSTPVTIAIDSTVVTLTGTQTLTNKTISGASNTLSDIGNASLTNSAITIGSTSVSLGGTITTFAGTSISGSTNTLTNIANASLTNSAITINGSSVSLGASVTVTATASNALTIGTGLTGTSYNGSAPVTIGIDSTVATLTGTQTLTNKTIDSPIINTPTISTPTLTGGTINNTPIGGTTPAAGAFTSVAMTSGTIVNAPVNGTDIVNKTYADAIASGIHFHEAVDLATTTALPANTYNNGASGVGATLTANANGALSVDSTLTVVGNRILVKNEVTQANNGVYVVTQVGSAGTPYILTRAADFDTAGTGVDQIDEGDFFLVTSGVVNLNTAWVQQTAPPITIGTTPIVFQQFAAPLVYSAGTGLNESPTYTFNIANTTVVSGSYGLAASVPTIAINAQGQITSASNTAIAIAATQVTSGVLAIAQGGTNSSATATAGGAVYGTGSAFAFTAAGTAGQVLTSAGASAPVWSGISGGTF
jgi:hypothetical protein